MASNHVPVKKPHVVCLPGPAQSHITATLKLAKLLHSKGCHITFVNTEFNHRRMINARGGPSFLDSLPLDFQFLTIPDGLPASDANATQDIAAICDSCRRLMTAPFCDLVEGLNERSALDPSFAAVSCILSDGFMPFTTGPASEKFGIPVVNLWTVPACVIMCFMQYSKLMEKGYKSSRDVSCPTNGYLDTIIDWIPGMKNLRLRDITNFIRTMEVEDIMFEYSFEAVNRTGQAIATVIHTFEELEKDVLDALSSMYSGPVYAIGPSSLLLDRIPEEKNNTSHVACNLWAEDSACLEWLDSKAPGSVLYINFGSIAVLSPEQLVEFAMGIADSEHYFLWVIRPDLVSGDGAILPKEFAEKTARRGFTTDWCPQEKVLNHPSIGGFLTHCGWNSTIESLSAGVPMLCWPYFGDQWTNCRFVCTEWACGLEIDHNVNREEVERLVKELMEGEKGKEMRKNAMEWKNLAKEATGPSGSSSRDLDRLVQLILSI